MEQGIQSYRHWSDVAYDVFLSILLLAGGGLMTIIAIAGQTGAPVILGALGVATLGFGVDRLWLRTQAWTLYADGTLQLRGLVRRVSVPAADVVDVEFDSDDDERWAVVALRNRRLKMKMSSDAGDALATALRLRTHPW